MPEGDIRTGSEMRGKKVGWQSDQCSPGLAALTLRTRGAVAVVDRAEEPLRGLERRAHSPTRSDRTAWPLAPAIGCIAVLLWPTKRRNRVSSSSSPQAHLRWFCSLGTGLCAAGEIAHGHRSGVTSAAGPLALPLLPAACPPPLVAAAAHGPPSSHVQASNSQQQQWPIAMPARRRAWRLCSWPTLQGLTWCTRAASTFCRVRRSCARDGPPRLCWQAATAGTGCVVCLTVSLPAFSNKSCSIPHPHPHTHTHPPHPPHLADLLLRYIGEAGAGSHHYAELAGRSDTNPVDVVRACWAMCVWGGGSGGCTLGCQCSVVGVRGACVLGCLGGMRVHRTAALRPSSVGEFA